MSYMNPSMGSGSRTARRALEFGRTYVVRPKGKHQATIIWLHGLGDNGSSSSQLLESLSTPNIKWICPTAPTRPVAMLGGFPCTAWFDAGELSDDTTDDLEGLEASVAHIANLLSTEPADGKFFTMSWYILCILCLKIFCRNVRNKIEGSHEAVRCAASLPILLCHGKCDEVVPYRYGERAYHVLSSAGFRNLQFKAYDGLGHYTVPKEMSEVCNWLTVRLALEGLRR
uniref:Acyl-protein thioesterase 2-like n=1 Tax=Nicotiana tabacum TaxID=4097 RepID=A0A1S4DDJ0_TOBAC|nr:PREDICTED: acyl-protein thioesterase 2-like [Nicotiana tabacum]